MYEVSNSLDRVVLGKESFRMTGNRRVISRQLGKEFGIFPKGSGKALKGFK